jgi:hypothetical protein
VDLEVDSKVLPKLICKVLPKLICKVLPNNSLVLPNNSLVLPKQIYKVLGPVVSGLGFRDIGYIGVDLGVLRIWGYIVGE